MPICCQEEEERSRQAASVAGRASKVTKGYGTVVPYELNWYGKLHPFAAKTLPDGFVNKSKY